MANYVESEKIQVFPSALRSARSEGKYTSEPNIVGLLMSLADEDSFCISHTDDVTELVIHGYYFNITGEVPAGKYAYIRLDASDRLVAAEGQDAALDYNNNFIALAFSDVDPTSSENIYSLQIRDGSDWIANEFKFDSKSIYKKVNDELISLENFISGSDLRNLDVDGSKEYLPLGIDVNDDKANFKKVKKIGSEAEELENIYTKKINNISCGSIFEGRDGTVQNAVNATTVNNSIKVDNSAAQPMLITDIFNAAGAAKNAVSAESASTVTGKIKINTVEKYITDIFNKDGEALKAVESNTSKTVTEKISIDGTEKQIADIFNSNGAALNAVNSTNAKNAEALNTSAGSNNINTAGLGNFSPVYFNDGKPSNCPKIYIGNTEPQGAQNGDIWFAVDV